jgi:hypothetical protein
MPRRINRPFGQRLGSKQARTVVLHCGIGEAGHILLTRDGAPEQARAVVLHCKREDAGYVLLMLRNDLRR